jgi:hypothetical protein
MICGHMRVLGDERVLHVCIKTDIVHEDDHLLVPWQEYADATVQHARDRDQEVPEWFAVLDTQARHINRQEFIKALREDPMLREVPADDPPPPLPDESDPPHIKDSKWQARTAWDERQRKRRQQPERPAEPAPDIRPILGGDEDLQPGYVPPGMAPTTSVCLVTRQIPPHPRPGTRAMLQQCGEPVMTPEPPLGHQHGNWQDLGLLPPQPERDPEPSEQCLTTRRDPLVLPPEIALQQCGRPAGHPEDDRPTLGGHDEWVDVPGVPAGRSQGDTWREVHEDDPDAWRAPDDADRSAEPPPGGAPEADLGYAPGSRGKPPRLDLKLDFPGDTGGGAGGSMASVAEVRAALDGVVHQANEAQGGLFAAKEKIGEAEQGAMMAAEGSGHDSVASGNAFLAQAKEKVDEALQLLEAAKEAYGQYSAGL